VSKASELFPDPESPVMTTSLSRGISTSMFFRLFARAPFTMRCDLFIFAKRKLLRVNCTGENKKSKPLTKSPDQNLQNDFSEETFFRI
jgi:hypothetical protein